MPRIQIENFSCLSDATIELAPVNVIIGPQGSGKSVSTKLIYFCNDLLSRQYDCAEKGLTLSDFKKDVERSFKIWFPPSAWGSRRFNINFSAGPFTVRILRRLKNGSVSDEAAVSFSPFFEEGYQSLLKAYREVQELSNKDGNFDRASFTAMWRVREKLEKSLSKSMGSEYVQAQVFIPAGRAFFTSIGRLVAAFETGSSLDPVTIRFAKLFANLRDAMSRGFRFGFGADISLGREMMLDLFGGEIKFDKDVEVVHANDGRIIPFSALSSGQQELLPMWLLIDAYAGREMRDRQGFENFYIEEPEAHLFPEAQSKLIDFLVGNLSSQRFKRNLLITTHSPYILAKMNNYLKAGQLGTRRSLSSAVEKLVPRPLWLKPDLVRAYSIESGKIRNLMDSGLIDGSYIDNVSSEVGDTFSKLLDIEFA